MLQQALQVATKAHEGQVRKYSGVPYITHPRAVQLAIKASGGDIETQAAGLLHDVLEDSTVTERELRLLFGGNVTDIVSAVTHTEGDWKSQRVAYIDRIKKGPIEAVMVALADKLCNLSDLMDTGVALSKGQEWWFNAVLEVGLDRLPTHPLTLKLQETLKAA